MLSATQKLLELGELLLPTPSILFLVLVREEARLPKVERRAAALAGGEIPLHPGGRSVLERHAGLVHRERGKGSFAQQWPWAIAFAFGLLHGFGFAGALNEIGLPQQAIPLSLLFFNIGVEIGQILFIVVVYLVWALTKRIVVRLPEPITSYGPAYAIGTVAAFWTIERIAGF